MKTYTLRFRAVNADTFRAIKSRQKKVETRAATEKYRNIQAGDTIKFVCKNTSFQRKVSSAKIFKSISAILKTYKPSEINPKCKTNKEAEAMWLSFGYKDKIKKFGLIALELK